MHILFHRNCLEQRWAPDENSLFYTIYAIYSGRPLLEIRYGYIMYDVTLIESAFFLSYTTEKHHINDHNLLIFYGEKHKYENGNIVKKFLNLVRNSRWTQRLPNLIKK
jgi:hypothetical protein